MNCPWEGCEHLTIGLCRGHTKRLREAVDQLVADYVTIRATLPRTSGRGRTAPRGSRTYGHPAAEASDICAQIAGILDIISEDLRDYLGHLPPPPLHGHSESRTVNHAYQTILNRWETLLDFPGTEAATAGIREARKHAGRLLGIGGALRALPAPCPECGNLPVFRQVGMDRSDRIVCQHDGCNWSIGSERYGLYARVLLDTLLDADTPTEETS